MSRTIIVSNRLPVKINAGKNGIEYKSSEGGLATALGSVYKEGNNLWIGWPGMAVEENLRSQVTSDLMQQNLLPVYLTEAEITDYYEGFSNETIWPLFHYFPSFSSFNHDQWECYKSVNRKFADAILRIISPGDIVWVHDYQLMLVPEMLREAMPGLTIGFFLHIPFPSYEVFRTLPWRKELLCGLVGADIIGFHTYDDARHFISSVQHLTDKVTSANEIVLNDRKVKVGAFPISVNYKKFNELASESRTCSVQRKIKQLVNNNKLLMSVDRLDYSKGITHRLRAFQVLLEKHPELHGKIRLVQLIVPSRDNVQKYKELKEEMNKLVGEINGQYGTFGWQPIHHFYRSFPPRLLSALYKASDIALVTPIRDGMNLVCKEYIASRTDKKGVLVLSEMAGASRELSQALMVNPNDIFDFADKMYEAINMPESEQKKRMVSMQQTVSKYSIDEWLASFSTELAEIKQRRTLSFTKDINAAVRTAIFKSYKKSRQRLISLDYDGTLVPFKINPADACPDVELLQLLDNLSEDSDNNVVITSGRDYRTLDKWFGHMPVDIIAEHGAWTKLKNGSWRSNIDLDSFDWYSPVMNIMKRYCERNPGTFIEQKTASLVWHYRGAAGEMIEMAARAFMNDIKYMTHDKGLQVLQADKAIEVKNITVNKGTAIRHWLQANDYDFVLAMGDDLTDEDTFRALPSDAITIKIGKANSCAAYAIEGWMETRALLANLALSGSAAEITNVISLVKAAG